jgi:DNA-binding MarR family transcriptional regulator
MREEVTSEQLDPRELAAWRGLLRVHSALIGELDAELQDHHDLSLSSYEVLLFLGEAPRSRLRMSRLAESVLLSLSGMTRLVNRLEKQGLVRKDSCSSDGRGIFAVLTTEGRARLEDARTTHLAGVRRLFLNRYSADELEAMARLWHRVVPGAAAAIPDLQWNRDSEPGPPRSG